MNDLDILFEDETLLVLNKPIGIHSVDINNVKSDSIASLVRSQNLGCDNPDAGLCHRLDKETSGALVVAKNQEAYLKIRELFSENKVTKEYHALVEGNFSKQKQITSFLYGRYKRSKKVSVAQDIDLAPKHAKKCELKVIKATYSKENDLTDLSLSLITGFRHQIRAQLAYLSHPLVGDTLYGSEKKLADCKKSFIKKMEGRKFYLHACRIAFCHPKSGERINIKAK